MSKFRITVWYVGVFVVSLTLLLSFVTKNWLLTGLCVVVTAILKSNSNDIPLPRIYREKGVSNAHFSNGGNNEKNNK